MAQGCRSTPLRTTARCCLYESTSTNAAHKMLLKLTLSCGRCCCCFLLILSHFFDSSLDVFTPTVCPVDYDHILWGKCHVCPSRNCRTHGEDGERRQSTKRSIKVKGLLYPLLSRVECVKHRLRGSSVCYT